LTAYFSKIVLGAGELDFAAVVFVEVSQEQLMLEGIQAIEAIVTKPTSDLAQYFNGTTPAGSRNFLDPANKDLLHELTIRLVAFFGQLLGCNDPTFPKFHKTANFRRLHHRMMLTDAEFQEFNGVVLTVLNSAGFSNADVGLVGVVLNGFQSKIVFSKRVPAASVTGFPPIPSVTSMTTAKTTAKKTTATKTTAKTAAKTTAKKTATKTTAKKTATKTTAKKTATKTTAKKTATKTTAKKTTAKKTA